jgi:hypothetical protein
VTKTSFAALRPAVIAEVEIAPVQAAATFDPGVADENAAGR